MPELPEVETIRRILEPQLAGRMIESVEICNAQIIAHPDAGQFAQMLQGQTIRALSRRGKYLTLDLESGDRLSLHLRMTGQLLVMPAAEPREKHTHLILQLSDGNQLRYIDVRRFGRFWYLRQDEEDVFTARRRLGPEPDDPVLSAEYLRSKLGSRKKTVKEVLLDQEIIAGIGNIYSDEILFAAGIYPAARCSSLGGSDWERLAEEIPRVISWGIESNQMTAQEYLRGKGKEYRNTPYLRVYGRSGQPCKVCGSTLEKIKIGGRSSCFCPKCQRDKTEGS